jgi:5-methylcytosine-specific restriction protein A
MRINWTYDEIVLAAELARTNGWKALDQNDPGVIELSKLLQTSHLHPLVGREPAFRNPNGVGRKTADICTRHPKYVGKRTNGNRLDLVVLRAYLDDPARMICEAAAIREALVSGEILQSNGEIFNDEAVEGGILFSRHLRRERNRGLRNTKIRKVLEQKSVLACEVCGFNFEESFGDRGRNFIEAHHVRPLHTTGEVKTRLDDLVLLCSNCHSMIHRTPWLQPEELRSLITSSSHDGTF